jgi:hypothetical protein
VRTAKHPQELEDERNKCHWCQIRTFSTHEDCPIAIINDVDDQGLSEDFTFIESSILCEGVKAAEEGFRTGCECATDRECQRLGCHCLQDMEVPENGTEGGKIYAYHTVGNRKECLRGPVLESRAPIYECHGSCACSEDCSNRVVERGRKVPLQVFRTGDGRGWGIFSLGTVIINLLSNTQVFDPSSIFEKANSSINISARSLHLKKQTAAGKIPLCSNGKMSTFSRSTNSPTPTRWTRASLVLRSKLMGNSSRGPHASSTTLAIRTCASLLE